jgi:5-methylcytosine-specific restriction endonuclease McrA
MGGRNNAPLLWGRWARKSRGTGRNYPYSYRVLRAEVLAEGRCRVCGGEPRVGDPLEVDHIVPIELGGTHARENLRPMHRSENRKRGAELRTQKCTQR